MSPRILTRPPRKISCITCRRDYHISPATGRTYEQEYRTIARAHEQNGCEHHRYDVWGFDPAWDAPESKEMIRSSAKKRIVQHPDGYMFSVPADWDQDAIDLHIDRTRKRRKT